MSHLLQAATLPPVPNGLSEFITLVTPFALLALGWMQARSAEDRRDIKSDMKQLTNELASIRQEVTALNTHVGVDGNGIISRLDGLASTLDEIKMELAENRGARHIRAKGD
jgi:hypothetical protein